ncbi:MAG: MOSC domain-containing protein [Chthoniobacterales bacterium]
MVHKLYISPGHNFFGHHGREADTHPTVEVDSVECVAGSGLRGDRFFNYKPDYKGQITFFSLETLQKLWEDLEIPLSERDISATRRNVITTGMNLPALIGKEFEVQGIRFLGMEECRPCYWMNGAIHEKAEMWMKGRGGLRAKILSDGTLTLSTASDQVLPSS